jgi:hypothetical protein
LSRLHQTAIVPRNDQITRQWHLLRRLESSRGVTLPELVESVPNDYPKNARTVRRDLEALEAVGFSAVTERHNGPLTKRVKEEAVKIAREGKV